MSFLSFPSRVFSSVYFLCYHLGRKQIAFLTGVFRICRYVFFCCTLFWLQDNPWSSLSLLSFRCSSLFLLYVYPATGTYLLLLLHFKIIRRLPLLFLFWAFVLHKSLVFFVKMITKNYGKYISAKSYTRG